MSLALSTLTLHCDAPDARPTDFTPDECTKFHSHHRPVHHLLLPLPRGLCIVLVPRVHAFAEFTLQ